MLSRRKCLAVAGIAFISGVACRRTVLARNEHPALVNVTVNLVDVEDGRSVLHYVGLVQIGQAMRLVADAPDGQTVSLGVMIEHYSAAQQSLTIRAEYVTGGQVLVAPVFVVRPDEVAKVEIGVDERRQVLSVAASVMLAESRSETIRANMAMPVSIRSSSKSKSG